MASGLVPTTQRDRKSTRLNSSHRYISYSLFFFLMIRRPPRSPLFPSPTLFRSECGVRTQCVNHSSHLDGFGSRTHDAERSEEHTSELQSPLHLLFPLFFFNDPATPEISPLPLPDALPI